MLITAFSGVCSLPHCIGSSKDLKGWVMLETNWFIRHTLTKSGGKVFITVRNGYTQAVFLSWNEFIVLTTERDRSNCVRNYKSELVREVQTLLMCTPGQLLCNLGLLDSLAGLESYKNTILMSERCRGGGFTPYWTIQ